jgi:hypothetical protein
MHGEPLLHAAIKSGQVATVRLLLERLDLDINALNEFNESAIFVAISRKEARGSFSRAGRTLTPISIAISAV